LFKLDQVGATRDRVLMDTIKMRFVPYPRTLQFGRPARTVGAYASHRRDERVPISGNRPRREGRVEKRSNRVGSIGHMVEDALGRCRAKAWHQLHHPKSGDAVTWIFCETKQRQQVFDVGGIEEFEPAKFDERNIPSALVRLQAARYDAKRGIAPPAP